MRIAEGAGQSGFLHRTTGCKYMDEWSPMEQPFWPKEARERKFGLLKNRGACTSIRSVERIWRFCGKILVSYSRYEGIHESGCNLCAVGVHPLGGWMQHLECAECAERCGRRMAGGSHRGQRNVFGAQLCYRVRPEYLGRRAIDFKFSVPEYQRVLSGCYRGNPERNIH